MPILTNSEGIVLTCTNELLETISLQLNSSNSYNTTGEHNIIVIKIGSSRLRLLDHTYNININVIHNFTINEIPINGYSLELVINGTNFKRIRLTTSVY